MIELLKVKIHRVLLLYYFYGICKNICLYKDLPINVKPYLGKYIFAIICKYLDYITAYLKNSTEIQNTFLNYAYTRKIP